MTNTSITQNTAFDTGQLGSLEPGLVARLQGQERGSRCLVGLFELDGFWKLATIK